jgi:hypothetical protein
MHPDLQRATPKRRGLVECDADGEGRVGCGAAIEHDAHAFVVDQHAALRPPHDVPVAVTAREERTLAPGARWTDARVAQRLQHRREPLAIDDRHGGLAICVAKPRNRVHVRRIGQQSILDRVGEQFANRRGVHARQLQAREEDARGRQHGLDLVGARDVRRARVVFAQYIAARIEQHPGEARGGVGALDGGEKDA